MNCRTSSIGRAREVRICCFECSFDWVDASGGDDEVGVGVKDLDISAMKRH